MSSVHSLLTGILCSSIFVYTGCDMKGNISGASTALDNLNGGGSKISASGADFTAIFQANSTQAVGVYDENTTSGTIGGKCTPGAIIKLTSTITDQNSVFCNPNGTWSVNVENKVWTGSSWTGGYTNGSAGGSGEGLLVSEVGTASATTTFNIIYSPTTFPPKSNASHSVQGADTYLWVTMGDAWSSDLNGAISNIGLTSGKQYQYRLDIMRSGSILFTLSPFSAVGGVSKTTPSSYTWQNGDVVRITAFDSSGDGPVSSDIPIN